MDNSLLRRKDTTKGPPLRILSLDGGGVRGYSMLIILQALMYRSFVESEGRAPKREEIPKPADYFDLIAGTGTGGLIAIMLGRLRLDVETCMEVYVRMTKKVFETDKTIAGIPYKTTLFKASKLEEAIKACVKEHTIFDDEGNDGTATGGREFSGMSPTAMGPAPKRSMSVRSNSTLGLSSPTSARNSMLMPALAQQWGNADASLYDDRENRTKTAVTAVYKGTPKTGSSILLRSYDSRKEPPPTFNCSIWQAGRATSATGLAFKPIQIGQSIFIDEGAGKYNPSPQILEEATVNEWPGREVGIFVSIGTGKRPSGSSSSQHEWWEGFVGGSVGNFAEARRRLIAKIEGCEETHQQMLKSELKNRGVPVENYCRLNVEVGVGEFGMNEWDRLSEMNTGTQKYLQKPEVQKILLDGAMKIAKIQILKKRLDNRGQGKALSYAESFETTPPLPPVPPTQPSAIELAGDEGQLFSSQNQHYRNTSDPSYPYQQASDDDKFVVVHPEPRPMRTTDKLPYRQTSQGKDGAYIHNNTEPPPIPPKTPIEDSEYRLPSRRMNGNFPLPYPDTDGPPPMVNKLRKPEFTPR